MLFLLLRRVKDPHEFFTGDCFLFIQHLCQLIQQRTVLRQQAVRPLMLRADELNDLAVDLALRLLRAAHGRIAAQILIPRGLHGDHVEFIRHAVLRDHGARDARGLLDVVRSAGRDLTERDLLGRAAEEVAFGEITTGASNDIEQATRIARAMIAQYGMTDEFDMVAMQTTRNQYLGGDTSMSCSEQTQREIDRKVVELVRTEHERAHSLLTEHRALLDQLAQVLYEKETITGEEFMRILHAAQKEEEHHA